MSTSNTEIKIKHDSSAILFNEGSDHQLIIPKTVEAGSVREWDPSWTALAFSFLLSGEDERSQKIREDLAAYTNEILETASNGID